MPHGAHGFRRLTAVAKQRCPRCLQGQVFATLFRTHEQCPVCGLWFEREPGYVTGAMSLSDGLAVLATAPVWLTLMRPPGSRPDGRPVPLTVEPD